MKDESENRSDSSFILHLSSFSSTEFTMSTVTAPAKMTAEEFAEWVERPENADRWFELVRGEVIELGVPIKIHGRVCINVGYLLEGYVRQRGFGYVTSNASLLLLQPDPATCPAPHSPFSQS